MAENVSRLCAVITEETIDAARAAMMRAATVADIIEIRLDYLTDFDFSNELSLHTLLDNKTHPVIITCRAMSEGGKQFIDDRVRLRLLVEGARRLADYCDIEADHYQQAATYLPDISRLIVSYHNFDETPADLGAIYDRVTALPAAVHKIVTRAKTIDDSLAILRLLEVAKSDGRNLIAVGMGSPGAATRVLSPSRGGFLTYCALDHGKESAPGQFRCDELSDTYHIQRISETTEITGIIGNPVMHSASPAMHNRAFEELHLDLVYLPFEVADLGQFVRRFVRPETRELNWNLRGLSVTIPYKSDVIPLLDEVDSTASEVGAVNTVVIAEGKLLGFNTDIQGAIEPLARTCALEGESCGVIGSGGAAKAIIYGLIKSGARVTVFARDPAKARNLSNAFGVSVRTLDSIERSEVPVLINTTPAGMRDHSEGSSPIPAAWLAGRKIVYDLVYNPQETRLITDARKAGCHTIGGLDMLVAQGALQFELWTGRQPPVAAMREAALAHLRRK